MTTALVMVSQVLTHIDLHRTVHAPAGCIGAPIQHLFFPLFKSSLCAALLTVFLDLFFYFFNLSSYIYWIQFETMHASLCPEDEGCTNSRQLCGGNQAATERMIQFGRELQALNEQLCREYGKNATHKKMLQVHTHAHTHLISANSCAAAD